MNGTVIKNQFELPSSMDWGTPIWTNSSPTSAYAATTISLSLSNYNEILIAFVGDSTTPIWYQRAFIDWDSGQTCTTFWNVGDFDSSNSPAFYFREVHITKTSIYFGDGYKKMSNATGGGTKTNNAVVPYCIYAR